MQTFLKLEYGVDPDTIQDNELGRFIVAARRAAEKAQNRRFVVAQIDYTADYWLSRKIKLLDKLRSVDLVQYRDYNGEVFTLTENVDYIVDASKQAPIIAPYTFKIWPPFMPWPSSAILVRFTCGYAPDDPYWYDDGATVKLGMCELIAHWFNNRVPYTRAMGNVEEFPMTVQDLLYSGANIRSEY